MFPTSWTLDCGCGLPQFNQFHISHPVHRFTWVFAKNVIFVQIVTDRSRRWGSLLEVCRRCVDRFWKNWGCDLGATGICSLLDTTLRFFFNTVSSKSPLASRAGCCCTCQLLRSVTLGAGRAVESLSKSVRSTFLAMTFKMKSGGKRLCTIIACDFVCQNRNPWSCALDKFAQWQRLDHVSIRCCNETVSELTSRHELLLPPHLSRKGWVLRRRWFVVLILFLFLRQWVRAQKLISCWKNILCGGEILCICMAARRVPSILEQLLFHQCVLGQHASMPRTFWEFSQYSNLTLLLPWWMCWISILVPKIRALPCLRAPSIILVSSNPNVQLYQFAVHLDRNDVPVL